METAIGIVIIILALALGFVSGNNGLSKDQKIIIKKELYKKDKIVEKQKKEIEDLKELRKLDEKTIEDLQKRLRKNNLDDSIG